MKSQVVPPFVRSAYNYDVGTASLEAGLKCEDVSLAQQHMRDECDINVIVERFGVAGRMPTITMPPMQGDFSAVSDFQTAVNMVSAAQASFMTLPADVRSQFQNDPGSFVDFVSQADSEQLRTLGLLRKPEEPPMTAKSVAEAIKAELSKLLPPAPPAP